MKAGVLVRSTGPMAAIVTIVLSLVLNSSGSSGWEIGLALVALAAGIPHGAVDHLIISRPTSLVGWIRFIFLYIAAAGAAIWFIFTSPKVGFALVVLMTIFHFGSGDTAYLSSLPGAATLGRPIQKMRVVASGTVPILLPLTHPDSSRVLNSINPDLVGWISVDVGSLLRIATIALAVVTAIALVVNNDRLGGIELLLLVALCVIASPLVAFAIYFSTWHALRHTARLAGLRDDEGKPLDPTGVALAKVALAGVPALILVAIFSIVMWPVLTDDGELGGLLWVSLAMVWGLTVPHMTLVARLDRRSNMVSL